MDFEQYKNPNPYPIRPAKPTRPHNGSPKDYREHADKLEAYEKEFTIYKEKQHIWNTEQIELDEKFKKDALEDAGLTGHPKADKVYGMAYEHGHSEDYSDIAYWVNELADLVL